METALDAGATDLLLPMVAGAEEAGAFLEMVGGRSTAGILVETSEGFRQAPELARLPVDHVYVGLNDLAISRGSACIFDAVVDGTVEEMRAVFARPRFGFGGLTVVDAGAPVPCRLLMAEMVRLGCDFTFLRRSFKRDVAGRDLGGELLRMEALWSRLARRSAAEVEADRAALAEAVDRIPRPLRR